MDSEPHTLRDDLAVTRTRLANERTLLAYVRTSIMLAASGATVIKFFGEQSLAIAAGWSLIVASGGVALLGVRRFRRFGRGLV